MGEIAVLGALAMGTRGLGESLLLETAAHCVKWLPSSQVPLLPPTILICLIVAMIVSKRATITIGLSDQWRAIRRRRMTIGWIGAITSIVDCGVGFTMLQQPQASDAGIFLLLGGISAALGFVIYGLLASRMVAAKKIDDNFVYLQGCHPDFLNQFESTKNR